ncbi:LysR substrate-binding domain-containing protein [Gammaproteobacteria bacterium]|nr:LysR substrate-binding domain-containing protein [Gammaproteobacteria bacterium]
MSNSNTRSNPAKLDSELLRTFLMVASSGSLSAAAARIFRSQSAVSLQVKQLESILGHSVFQRHARGVKLTTVGTELLPRAQQVVDLLDETINQLRSNPLQGAIRVGIPDEYGDGVLAEVIARFARNHPRVELSVRCGFSADFPEALARDELDIAVHAVESSPGPMLKLRTEKAFWVTSKNHNVHLLDPLPVALFDRQCWWRDRALEALRKSGRRFQINFSSESVTGITAAVSAGVAVGMVGENSLRDNFRVLSAKDGFAPLPASILVLERRQGLDNAVAQAMCRAIRDAFGKD